MVGLGKPDIGRGRTVHFIGPDLQEAGDLEFTHQIEQDLDPGDVAVEEGRGGPDGPSGDEIRWQGGLP